MSEKPSILTLPMTYERALEVYRECNNGNVEHARYSDGAPVANPSKGGRYWLDGEFTIVQLKALIVIAEKQFNDAGYPFVWDHDT